MNITDIVIITQWCQEKLNIDTMKILIFIFHIFIRLMTFWLKKKN